MEAKSALQAAQELVDCVPSEQRGMVSDGYHTFNELYEFRKLYNACFFNILYSSGQKVVKSKKHHDGKDCFGGGWFVVVADLPLKDGSYVQVSNHYKQEDWDLFRCMEVDFAPEWDGHTPQDVKERLISALEWIASRRWTTFRG